MLFSRSLLLLSTLLCHYTWVSSLNLIQHECLLLFLKNPLKNFRIRETLNCLYMNVCMQEYRNVVFFSLFFLFFFLFFSLFFLGFSWFFLFFFCAFLIFPYFFFGFLIFLCLFFSFSQFSQFFFVFLVFSQFFLFFFQFLFVFVFQFFLVFNDFQELCISMLYVIFLKVINNMFRGGPKQTKPNWGIQSNNKI